LLRALARLGMATADSKPMMATTIMISIKVKPPRQNRFIYIFNYLIEAPPEPLCCLYFPVLPLKNVVTFRANAIPKSATVIPCSTPPERKVPEVFGFQPQRQGRVKKLPKPYSRRRKEE